MKTPWIGGNDFRLLENGEQFYPAVFDAIAAARREVLLETFILFEDKVGVALHGVLLDAAKRGVQVDVTIDGWGSPDLSQAFVDSLLAAGVRFHVFEPATRLFGVRLNMFRRMHRKIVVVDGERAFVGGINYSADHLLDFGPKAKQDYAVEARGPIVDEIRAFALSSIDPQRTRRRWFDWRWRAARVPMPVEPQAAASRAAGSAEAIFVTRDNQGGRHDIERQYRLAFRAARREIIVANAYFFPGYRLLRDMRRAARRGVSVHLIVQGEPDMPIVKIAARLLYDHLLRSGVRIHEYCDRPLHGKVALVDDEWATVGSSNLDPLSLALNLEANVVVRDREFARTLRERLERLIRESCKEVPASQAGRSVWWRSTVGFVVFHFVRRFPAWAGVLPEHRPKIDSLGPASAANGASTQTAAEPPR
ncbi:MAG TPA: cardiolipin synthase ClsB [Burkholderiaceae bacterium]|nr:cardiolipin synthase ClsB [Burkholderiaceae bacterium]HRA78101.1 cardiolipin synthase ClsB [Burkholderiaceae bacterium]